MARSSMFGGAKTKADHKSRAKESQVRKISYLRKKTVMEMPRERAGIRTQHSFYLFLSGLEAKGLSVWPL